MRFIASCQVDVNETILSVMDAALPDSEAVGFFSFLGPQDWQGFAWMPGTVNFLVADEDGALSEALVEVYLSDHIELCPDTFRAIQVPFRVGNAGISIFNYGKIVAGTAHMSLKRQNIVIPVPPGDYALVCEIKFRDDEEYLNSEEYIEGSYLRDIWCRLTFVPQENAEPAVLRADSFLNLERIGGVLVMEAEPL